MIDVNDGLLLTVESGDPAIIHAIGELNYRNCDALRRLIDETSSTCRSKLALDLSRLDFVDSSGLRILAIEARDARKAGRSLQIVALTRQLSHALDISHLRTMFDIPASSAEVKSPDCLRVPVIAPQCFELTPDLDSCRDARHAVCGFASSLGFDATALDDIRLAVGEAISNAVRHGACGNNHIKICCSEKDRKLQVTLQYPSRTFDPHGVPEPDLASSPSGGMGIYFMKLVMDSVDYDFVDEHVIVKLEKRFEPSVLLQQTME